MLLLLVPGSLPAQGWPEDTRISITSGTVGVPQDPPIQVCQEVIASQDREITIANQRIATLQQQIDTQSIVIKALESRVTEAPRASKWRLGLTVVGSVAAIVGVAVGR